jgi:cytochrome P450 family 9
VCVKDYQYDYDGKKFTIEKGKFFMIPIHGFHHDPQYFPEPEKFDPERFSPENRHNIDPDTYLPFGVGPRNCIGSRFAIMEVKTIIYYLMVNFQLCPSEKTQIPLKLMKKPLAIGMKTEKGIWVKMVPRQ